MENISDWMVQLHECQESPSIFPRTDVVVKCRNISRGCNKSGSFNKLIFHQHICSFPSFRSSYIQDIRTYKCTGYLCCVFADRDNYVIFNNSFIKHLGAQFFFKLYSDDEIHIQGFSLQERIKTESFKLKIKSGDRRKYVAGHFNSGKAAVFKFPHKLSKKDILEYKIILKINDPPIII